MAHSSELAASRKPFYLTWEKHQQKTPLSPLEAQILEVILLHPEYHSLLKEGPMQQEEALESNPFLHMSLHLALREQISTDRPLGIRAIYQKLMTKYQNISLVEHRMIEPLATCLWEAQRQQILPDEHNYLEKLSKLVQS